MNSYRSILASIFRAGFGQGLLVFSKNNLLWATLFFTSAVSLGLQSFLNGPTSDEAGHLFSAIATIRTGDPGFYRVNPPLSRIASGLVVELFYEPDLPELYRPSSMASGVRHEFLLADDFLTLHKNDYKRLFVVGRLTRIPFILLTAYLLLKGFPLSLRPIMVSATVLWLTSPFVLGHGWAIMPDALSGATMVLLLAYTFRWLKTRDWTDSVFVGVAWGLAIGTKFTFCPLFLMWPAALIMHQWISDNLTVHSIYRLVLCHFVHGIIALIVVIALFGGSEIGTSLAEHSFKSERLSHLTQNIGWIPSPFPKQFLVGIDEQQLDLEKGYPTYFLGKWYSKGLVWYYLVGILVKEQIIFSLGLIFAIVGVIRITMLKAQWVETDLSLSARKETKACLALCTLVSTMVLGILSLHHQMALNVRYAFPALPPLYLIIGFGVTTILPRRPRYRHAVIGVLLTISGAELLLNCPNYFAYANPLFGGTYRVPPALHDTNFDGGQDLWRLERWLTAHPAPPETQRYICIHSAVPVTAIDFVPNIPPLKIVQQILDARRTGEKVSKSSPSIEVIVMRGLGVAAPWTKLKGGQGEPGILKQIEDLLKYEPNEFITPTLAVYRE